MLPRRSVFQLFALLTFLVPLAAGAAAQEAESAAPELTEELLEPFEYRFIGPANQSGRVTAIAVPDSVRPKTYYAGFASGGVWKTTNAGVTWRPIFDDEAFASIGDVAVAPSDHDVVWVGTGERNSLRSNGWGDGVYRSTNGGRSWEHMGLEETRETGRIAIHPEDPDIVYVAALGHLWGANPERGVYRTTDGGETWEQILFVDDTTGFIDLEMDPRDPDVLYAAGWHRLRWGGGHMEGAGAGSGIWKTTDGGGTWTRLTGPGNERGLPESEKIGRIGLGIAPSNPDRIYAVIQVAEGAKNPVESVFGGIFRSDDAGASWTRVNDLSAVPDYYYNEVWIDPNDEDRIFLGQTMLMYSEDGGETIGTFRMRRVHVDHHAMWIDPADSDFIILGNDGGIYISYDGGDAWAHHTIPVGQFYEVDVDTTKVPYHVCGGTQDNGTWCGPSRTRESVGITNRDWYSVFGGDGFHSAVSPDDPNIRYAEYQYGNVSRFAVDTWEFESVTPHAEDAGAESGYAFRWDWNTPFTISHHDPTVVYLGGNHLFRLTDRGRDWTMLGPDMTRQNRYDPEPDTGHTSYHSLHSVAESTLDARLLWAGSNDGLLWVSTDGGDTWTNVTGNLPQDAQRCFVAEIEPSVHVASRAYVTQDCHRRDDYRPYVFRSDDNGESWTGIGSGLPQDAGTYVVREDPENPYLLYVGNQRGVYLTFDGGDHWIRLKNNLPTVAVRDMNLVPQERELVVGTYGRSIYVLDIGPLQEISEELIRSDAHLFRVKDARIYNRRNTYESFGQQFFTADNPPYGTVITYYLREDQGEDVRLTIRKVVDGGAGEPEEETQEEGEEGPQGDVVRRITASGRPGIHQVTWDLQASEPRPRELGGPTSRNELREVLPGTYSVSLRIGDETMTQTFQVHEGWVERMPGAVR